MSDIVERLRNRNTPFGWGELADKAADKIEQLRADLGHYADVIRSRDERCNRLEAEIERLNAERAGDQQRLFHYEGLIADAL